MTTTDQELMVIPKEMIERLRTKHCAGIVVEADAYKALMKLVETQVPVHTQPYVFDWPPTSNELSGMDRFCGGPSHEDYDASVYKGWVKPKVDALISQLDQVTALYLTYKGEVAQLKLSATLKDAAASVSESIPERSKFESYAREKGLRVDMAIWNMSDPPQFKEYVDPEAQAEWIHWQDIRSR